MHLLAATSGVIGDGEEAVDLDQPPGDILILSAADSELAALSAAHAALRSERGKELPSLRLASLLALRHNMSVDLWIEKTARHARMIIARVLGGRAYWTYGVDELHALARREGLRLVLLPGGAAADEELVRLSTVPPDVCEAFRRLFVAGGPENARALLHYAGAILEHGEAAVPPPAPHPLPAAGLWLDGRVTTDPERVSGPSGGNVPVVFYRALLEGGFTAPVECLVEKLERRGLRPLPVFVTSLKDPASHAFLEELLRRHPPEMIVNTTAFASATEAGAADPLARAGSPVLQAILSGSSEEAWRGNPQGLPPRDLAMNVALPELDGRIVTRAISFKKDAIHDADTCCNIVTYAPHGERTEFVAELAARWARLRATPPRERKVALILANYPNRDGRIGNGVGYDTPASSVAILQALRGAGYDVHDIPRDGNALVERLLAGPTNASGARRRTSDGISLSLEDYIRYFNILDHNVKKQIEERWGKPEEDPFFRDGAFHLPVVRMGNIVCAIQPARGYNIDPRTTYHDPALVPPHGYLAFYIWLREIFGAHAVVHNGKHGNLEWLPGKALALSSSCFPDAVLGPLPHLYPFIVNDPGEGSQAKRRNQAVVIDHLMPPMARAETYGELAELERLMDEYCQASGLDARRARSLRRDILDLARASAVDADAGLSGDDEEEDLVRLDAWLCEIKETQIRNGLHILGTVPEGRELAELLVALVRVPRGDGTGRDASLHRALAEDLDLDLDPLDCPDPAAAWNGPRPEPLRDLSGSPWRSAGDTVERIELLALRLAEAVISGRPADAPGEASRAVVAEMRDTVLPRLERGGRDEIANLLRGLSGRFVPPGPSGAPTRGRLDVLPTGRNFFSLDMRAVPTPAAWRLGRKSAENMLMRHFQEHGAWPRAIGLSVWGTSNMRTGGDDIAQALALIGVRPLWDRASGRVTGFEIMTPAELGRPRVDVTLRISGFFRDAFPVQIELFDRAVRAVGALDEPEAENPIAARMKREAERHLATGLDESTARRLAGHRVFGSRPGAYGAGLQALFDEKLWETEADLAESWINWGGWAYGSGTGGERADDLLRERLRNLDAVAHNQDNREHDILDSDDYYQFEGGMAAAVKHVKGRPVPVWHNDHSRPERPVTRSLEEEVSRVVRARVVNPKWISAMMRHGYKGAFEMAATVDYMFAFAATTGAVGSHHFELAFDAFIRDDEVRAWLKSNNPHALDDMVERFEEALARGFWRPRSNSAAVVLQEAGTRR